jgi:hypothetical protein
MFQKKGLYNGMRVSDIGEKIFSFWLRKYSIVFSVIFFGICAGGGFLWYYSLYYFHWNDEQKQTYIDSQSHKTALNTKDLENVLYVLDNRESVYKSKNTSVKNIFLTDPKPK